MRIPAAIVAATLTAAPAPATSVEQVLIDVNETHADAIDAINRAESDDEVRAALTAWRKDLIAAADELDALREAAAADGLTREEKAELDKADAKVERERAGVRELRATLLPDDPAVVVPAPIAGLGGILGTTAFDAFERSEQGDTPIVFGIPGVDRAAASAKATAAAPATTATTATEPLALDVRTMQDSDTSGKTRVLAEDETDTSTTSVTSTSTSTSSETTSSSTSTSTTTSTAASSTSTSTTTTSTTPSVMEHRTTSAVTTPSTSSSTSTTSSTTSSSTTTKSSTTSTVDDDDDERDDDLAETGTPMRGIIAAGALALLLGAVVMRLGRGTRR